jgi:hypothetical protein
MLGEAFPITPHENDSGLVVSPCALNRSRVHDEPLLEWLAQGVFGLSALYTGGRHYVAETVRTRPARQPAR